ncbi:MAG: hypothetical protein ACKOBW_18590 [Planctomycetota bacterium]
MWSLASGLLLPVAADEARASRHGSAATNLQSDDMHSGDNEFAPAPMQGGVSVQQLRVSGGEPVRFVSNSVQPSSKSVQWKVRGSSSSSSAANNSTRALPATSPRNAANSMLEALADSPAADPFRDPFGDRASNQLRAVAPQNTTAPRATQQAGMQGRRTAGAGVTRLANATEDMNADAHPATRGADPSFNMPLSSQQDDGAAGDAGDSGLQPPQPPVVIDETRDVGGGLGIGDSGSARSLPAAPPRAVDPTNTTRGGNGRTGSANSASGKNRGGSPGANAADIAGDAQTAAGGNGADGSSKNNGVRSATYCRRLYNERNCCNDESLCNEHRERVKSHPLSKISLDITPTANLSSRPGADQTGSGWPFENAPHRIWRNREGEQVAEGRVTGLANLRAEVTDDNGGIVRLPLRDLSEDDICFLAAFCGVPSECRLDDMPLVARNWSPITMTWKASGLCHRPLYFDEQQLERYGHTLGPLFQPALSGAHFFVNIAVLPYKMGVHPLNECQYPLGYYRPGNCAPKMIPPVPLSLRGALWQTGFVVGGIYVIP